MQAVCDDNSRFLEFDLGWPGNVQDTTVFRDSGIWMNKAEHFEEDEFILADKGRMYHLTFRIAIIHHSSGYPLTKFTIRPFADSDLTNDHVEAERRRLFNYKLSHIRISIEHAFGMLKGRFPALRCMPGYDLNAVCSAIETLMVIHNILIELHDDPEDIDGYNGVDDLVGEGVGQGYDVGQVPEHDRVRINNNMLDLDLYRTGLHRRKQLVDLVDINCNMF